MLSLALFRMDRFGGAHGCRLAKEVPLPKTCHTHQAIIKLGTVKTYLKKIQKVYKSRDVPLEVCIFVIEN